MIVLRFALPHTDLLSFPPSLHGHYPLHRYYEDSDFCQASLDVPAPADLIRYRSPLRGSSFLAVYLRCAPVPVFTSPPFSDILPPTTPAFSRTGSVSRRLGSTLCASRLRHFLVGSPFCCGRIVFTFVAVCQVLSVALHPASRRRSYFKFSPGTRFPMAEVFHLGGS